MKKSILPKKTINDLKLLKPLKKLHKIFKQNPKMLLFWVIVTILGHIKFVAVVKSLLMKIFKLYMRFKIYIPKQITYVITFVEIVEFILFTDVLAF